MLRWIELCAVISTILLGCKALDVYWNVPSFQCHKYGLDFAEINSTWGIKQNNGDNFRGNQVCILYDPGLFPALLPVPSGPSIPRNGGIPQLGNLQKHVDSLTGYIDKLVPNSNFAGLGVIDFEQWRPIWRQNWGTLSNYKDISREVEKKRHPSWTKEMVDKEAVYRYEQYARMFMLNTLRLLKKLRPNAKWGYYGYPYCFNYTPNNKGPSCSSDVVADNNRTEWLWSESGALYPSLYLKERGQTSSIRLSFMSGRLDEATRVSKRQQPVYPYIWYKYHDTKKFLSKEDMSNSLLLAKERSLPGVVIWGATNDVNTEPKCKALKKFVTQVLGPALKEINNYNFFLYRYQPN